MDAICKDGAGIEEDCGGRPGTWLKELRGRAGLSQIELAEKLGLKYYTFISQVENGFGRVPTESMEAWALALGADPSDFAKTTRVVL